MSSTTVTDPSKVQVSGEGLHFGYINHNIEALIDTRGAGPGIPFAINMTFQLKSKSGCLLLAKCKW